MVWLLIFINYNLIKRCLCLHINVKLSYQSANSTSLISIVNTKITKNFISSYCISTTHSKAFPNTFSCFLFSNNCHQSVSIRSWKTSMMICRCYKAKVISSAQSFIYHVASISRSHIMIIRISRVFIYRTSMFGINFNNRRNTAVKIIPVNSTIRRCISYMMRNCNGSVFSTCLHKLFWRISIHQWKIIIYRY